MKNKNINYEIVKKYTPEVFIENNIIPIGEEDIYIQLLSFEKNHNKLDIKALEKIFQKPLQIELCDEDSILKQIQKIKMNNQLLITANLIIENTKFEHNKNNFIEEFLKILLGYGVGLNSSDIHVEVQNNLIYFRFRIDGVLYDIFTYKIELFFILSAYLKVIAKLDVAQTKIPQDGRFSFGVDEKEFDFRISIIPTIHSFESIVLRILDKNKKMLDLNNLGIEKETLQTIQNNIIKSNGMILITGATGSGKTTTMYAIINALDKRAKKIITIEDPIEYEIEGIVQMSVDEPRGLTFSSILRNILRQDPDVILIGEIRDKESLFIAIEAALTGHLVITTLHTQNTIKTIDRLFDLGAKPFLIASVLKLVMSQKLMKRLCDVCKEKYSYQNKVYSRPIGCKECHFTGYQKRDLILEVLEVDKVFSQYIREENLSLLQLPKEKTIGYQIEQKLNSGVTSLEEYYSNEI